jgi:hypothetical protein
MSFLTTPRLLGLAVLTLLMAAPAAHAQDLFLPNDTTLDATNPVAPPFSAIVGYASFDDLINGVNPTSPTISIVTGANVNALEVHNSSIINMSDGSVGSGDFLGKLLSDDTSTINIRGGNVLFDVDVQSASTVNFSGGTVADDIVSHDNTTVNMSGGFVSQDLLINGSSTFNLSGGTVGDQVFVQDSSLLNVFGTGLSSALLDPNFEGFYSEYALSGSLVDNTVLANRIIFVQNGSGARFTLNNSSAVPEPGTLALLMGTVCGGGGLLLRRKRPNLR